MVELDDAVTDEIDHRGDSLVVDRLLPLVERGHDDGRPGIERELFETYLDYAAEPEYVDADAVERQIDSRLAAADEWVDDRTVYDLGDGRISALPPRWHELLAGETDLVRYVECIADATGGSGSTVGGAGRGVPKQLLIEAATILGGLDREEVRKRLQAARTDGDLVADADQHPDARIRLPE